MIVADTNLVAYFYIEGDRTSAARQVYARDPEWAAPRLWRSEMRKILVRYLRLGHLALPGAVAVMMEAGRLLERGAHEVRSEDVLRLAAGSGRSAYDCEFVALARALRVPLVTGDRSILAAFPDTALSLEAFAAA